MNPITDLPYHLRPGAPLRRVVCAANRHAIYIHCIALGARHFDPLMHAHIDLWVNGVGHDRAGWRSSIQGFIDQWGTWMDRKEALAVAKAAGQCVRRCGGDESQLYSEMLY